MRKSACWFLLIFICLGLFFYIIPAFSVIWSTTGYFNVTQETLNLNWTNKYNSSFNVTLNVTDASRFEIRINNETALASPSQFSAAFNYNSTPFTCSGTSAAPCLRLLIQDENGTYTRSANLTNLPVQNSTIFYISNGTSPYDSTIKAGKYKALINVYNSTIGSTEYASVTVFVDFPIVVNNDTGTGSFSGSFPSNTSSYHSYYFNTSSLQNATGIKINVSGWSSSQNVDLFLFDNNSAIVAKSINKTSVSESLTYNFLPSSPAMWEIRIYGNDTSSVSYTGNIFFTTLGSSNRSLDYFARNASTSTVAGYSNSTVITLNNTGSSFNLTNVMESKELYYVNRFAGNGTTNFTFLSPNSSIVQRIKVSLNWTGPSSSSYMFNVYKPDNTFSINSANKFLYANVTGADLEEYNETTDVTNGYWTVEVKNSTNISAVAPYNVTVYLYVNASNWFTTNYTNSSSGFTFSTINQPNSTTAVNISLTVPNDTMNGLYEGSFKYFDTNGAGISIPVKINVTTPSLVVNGTTGSTTATVVENVNTTLTKTVRMIINNTGTYSISSITTSNSTSLNYSIYNISFSYSAPTSIPAGSYGLLNITINLSTSTTSDTTGIYTGWIILNTSDSTYPSYPYPTFTANINFNLTDLLDVRITGIDTGETANWIVNSSNLPRNVTTNSLTIYYINDTARLSNLTSPSTFDYANISYVYLYNKNTGYTTANLPFSPFYVPSTGTSDFELPTYNFRFNFTVPANLPGGNYEVHIKVKSFNGKLQGESSNSTLSVNNAGLYMSTTNSTSFSISNTSITYFGVNVSNYGNVTSSGYINFNKPSTCSGYTVEYHSITGSWCGSASGTNVSVTVPGYNTSCIITWRITGGTSAASACTSNIIGSPSNQWFNPNGINVSVTVTAGGSSGDSSTSGNSALNTTATTLPAYTANLAFTKAESLIIVQQNSTNSTEVSVSNTGSINQNITFAIDSINTGWYSLNSTNAYLVVGRSAGFRVNFNVGNVEVKDYSGVFKAFSVNKTITSNFVLRVTPTPTTKTQINETLETYKLNMTKLEQQLDQLKKQGYNTTDVQKKFDELKLKVEQAENYIKGGDYNNAYYLFDDIKSLLSEVKDDLTKVKKTGFLGFISLPQGITLYILIGVGIAVGGFLAYLFWPTRGLAKPAYGATKTEEVKKPNPTGPSKLEQIKGLKEKLSKIFKREKSKPKYLLNESS